MVASKKELNTEHKAAQERDSSTRGTAWNSDREIRGLRLDKWQQEILNTQGHVLLCTGRQVGKTYIFSRKAAERMVSTPGSRIIVVSLTEDQAQLMIIMTLHHLESNYKYLIKKPYSKNITKNKIVLKNGSQILARPVGNTGDAVRGFTGDVLIVDEASKMPEMMWTAAKPTLLTTGGEIWMCSTPFGKQGYFYDCFLNKHDRFKVFHVSSEEVIQNREICDTWSKETKKAALRHLDEEKQDMSTLQYGQEYLGLFLEDLQMLFTDELIHHICVLDRPSIINRGANYYMGVDIARLGEDASTFQILNWIDRKTIRQVESIITQKQLTTQTFDKICNLERQYSFKKIGIDAGSGSLGVGILDFLLREPIVRKKVIALNNLSRALDHRGERKRVLLKEDMYLNLLSLMEKDWIKLLNDEEVRLSLRSVQYEYVRKQGMPTKFRIFSTKHKDSDIVEGLVRAAWLANQKHINISIDYV